ncbi:Respiratory burst oxidase [Carex littledalei]|uniref:Respiratory burst oxidase n=1 Tax=Carex littledalei TaxID=544730 RepID=A0A833VDI0_9POAL|nr:Respiratory burst oxidase [Carex littledalei]
MACSLGFSSFSSSNYSILSLVRQNPGRVGPPHPCALPGLHRTSSLVFVEITHLQDDNTIVLRSVEPATATAAGTEIKKLLRTHSHVGPAGANESGIESALAARAARRQRAQFDRTKSGAHKALCGLKFISGSRANSWAEVQRNFDWLAKDGFISCSDFAQCIGEMIDIFLVDKNADGRITEGFGNYNSEEEEIPPKNDDSDKDDVVTSKFNELFTDFNLQDSCNRFTGCSY